MRALLAVAALHSASSAFADTQLVPLQSPIFAAIVQHTQSELKDLLTRADDLARSTNFSPVEPVTFVLHGDEINLFRRQSYQSNASLVDLAARLDAFNVIDVRVCETWLLDNSVSPDELPPFVELVPFGPGFQANLKQRGAVPF